MIGIWMQKGEKSRRQKKNEIYYTCKWECDISFQRRAYAAIYVNKFAHHKNRMKYR